MRVAPVTPCRLWSLFAFTSLGAKVLYSSECPKSLSSFKQPRNAVAVSTQKHTKVPASERYLQRESVRLSRAWMVVEIAFDVLSSIAASEADGLCCAARHQCKPLGGWCDDGNWDNECCRVVVCSLNPQHCCWWGSLLPDGFAAFCLSGDTKHCLTLCWELSRDNYAAGTSKPASQLYHCAAIVSVLIFEPLLLCSHWQGCRRLKTRWVSFISWTKLPREE